MRLPVPKDKKPYTVVQPDLCLICASGKTDELCHNGAPDLVIEILIPRQFQERDGRKFLGCTTIPEKIFRLSNEAARCKNDPPRVQLPEWHQRGDGL